MSDTVLERHYRDRVESVRQLALHETGHGARSWRDFEDLLLLCYQLSVSGRELLEQEYKRVFKEHDLSVGWLRERRKAIEELSDNFLQLAESVKIAALAAWKSAGSPSGGDFVGRLNDAIRTVSQAKQSILQRWPVGSDLEIAEARAGATRTDGLDVDAAFAQIAGVEVESWRHLIDRRE